MKENIKYTLIAVGAAVAVVAVLFSSLFMYAGLWPPFSVVESGSMQHSEESQLGVIDTGDMVVVRDPSKTDIVSYVEGYHNGYSKFGEYGDVIIYERGGGKNPVIHRPIVWIEWNGENWDAPSLNGFPGWRDSSGNTSENSDGTGLSGTLYMTGIGFLKKNVDLNLDELPTTSGYATMGDSISNPSFDQSGGIIKSLVSNDMILYVAGIEIPWLGCIKLYATGTNIDQIPPNSIPCIICTAIGFILMITAIFVVIDYIEWYRNKNKEDGSEEQDDGNNTKDNGSS